MRRSERFHSYGTFSFHLCYGDTMPPSESEAREALAKRIDDSPLSIAEVARRCGKSYLWVWRRLVGKTSMKVDDYNLILAAIENTP